MASFFVPKAIRRLLQEAEALAHFTSEQHPLVSCFMMFLDLS